LYRGAGSMRMALCKGMGSIEWHVRGKMEVRGIDWCGVASACGLGL
jgi:hypothetical protein